MLGIFRGESAIGVLRVRDPSRAYRTRVCRFPRTADGLGGGWNEVNPEGCFLRASAARVSS